MKQVAADDVVDFSFIIPTYNRSGLLRETIDSFQFESTASFEIIVVDDGGSDDTQEMIQSLNDSRIQYHKIKNSERGAARNYGLQFARGVYVNYFDSDDLFIPCLDQLKSFLEENSFPKVIYGKIDNGGKYSTDNLPFPTFKENLLHNNFLACGAVFIDRNVALKFPFHEDRRLSSAEDWELWLRVAADHTFSFFPIAVFRQRMHDERSIITIAPERIEERDTYFAALVKNNIDLRNFFSESDVRLFVADRFSFIALSWCERSKSKAQTYLLRAFKSSFRVLSRRRFWAVLKNIMLR